MKSFLLLALFPASLFAADLPIFDFTAPNASREWRPAHDIAKLEQTRDGLSVQISGPDPYLIGPARDYPPRTNLWLHLRIKAGQAGVCQVFYFHGAATEV